MQNPWNKIPLQDYELHMQHESVGQMQMLNELTKKYLEQFKPEIIIFLGVAGGNGLEHIDNTVTSQVIGIDINENYLFETEKRFKKLITNLNLFKKDISNQKTENLIEADFIWAALIFEYVDIDKCFEFIYTNLKNQGHLIATIQANYGVDSISETGIESLKSLEQIFRIVEPDHLISCADKSGFNLDGFEENKLPNGKSFMTYTFKKH